MPEKQKRNKDEAPGKLFQERYNFMESASEKGDSGVL
jgi:hypothetical protein